MCRMGDRAPVREGCLRPAGEALDKLPAGEVIARDSILWDVFPSIASLASNTFDATGELSLHEQARIRCIVGEEMGWGDSGLAISLGVALSDHDGADVRQSGADRALSAPARSAAGRSPSPITART